MQLTASVQLPREVGGLAGEAIYLGRPVPRSDLLENRHDDARQKQLMQLIRSEGMCA